MARVVIWIERQLARQVLGVFELVDLDWGLEGGEHEGIDSPALTGTHLDIAFCVRGQVRLRRYARVVN